MFVNLFVILKYIFYLCISEAIDLVIQKISDFFISMNKYMLFWGLHAQQSRYSLWLNYQFINLYRSTQQFPTSQLEKMTRKDCKNVESFFKQISELSTTASAAPWSLFPVLTSEPNTGGTGLCYQSIPCGWSSFFTWAWRRTTWWTGTKWNFFRWSSGKNRIHIFWISHP